MTPDQVSLKIRTDLAHSAPYQSAKLRSYIPIILLLNKIAGSSSVTYQQSETRGLRLITAHVAQFDFLAIFYADQGQSEPRKVRDPLYSRFGDCRILSTCAGGVTIPLVVSCDVVQHGASSGEIAHIILYARFLRVLRYLVRPCLSSSCLVQR